MEEVLHPVSCVYCGSEVGVQDSDGVFHFFSVIPTYL